MPRLDAYVTFNGNCLEAFDFYKSIFGGEYNLMGRFSDMPPSPDYTVGEEDKDRVMHITYPIGEHHNLMGSDTFKVQGDQMVVGTNVTLSYGLKDHAEADRIFAALSEGGQVNMPMSNTFWQSYFGMLTDKFGIQWMISADPKPE